MQKDFSKSFDEAVHAVSPEIRTPLLKLNDGVKAAVNEIRLRANRPVVLVGSFGSRLLTANGDLSDDENRCIRSSMTAVTDTFNRLCGYSLHSHQNGINNGYVTVCGGHRAGVTGTGVCDSNGNLMSVRDIASVNIRISRECIGCADKIIDNVFYDALSSAIIAGPPASGKTTVLRDIARQLSSCGKKSCKVSVIDEREEIAAVSDGICFHDVGVNTDVLNSYPKKTAIDMAVRTMSPDIIVCDEVSSDGELDAIEAGVNSGVRFVVSVHASSYDELLHRPQIKRLLNTYSFEKLVLLDCAENPGKIRAIYDAKELQNEIRRCASDFCLTDADRSLCCTACRQTCVSA